MPVLVLIVVGLLVWAGTFLILQDLFARRDRRDLAERLAPFHDPARHVADEAERWLGRR